MNEKGLALRAFAYHPDETGDLHEIWARPGNEQ
jgi:hypothetical protein